MQLSAGVNFAWQIAADEAIRLQHEHIEPPILLVGICAVEKLFTPGARESMQLSEADLARASAEWEQVASRLQAAGLSGTELRRNVRSQVMRGTYAGPARHKIGRSPETIEVFKLADELAGARSAAGVELIDLFSALIRYEGTANALAASGVPVAKLREQDDRVNPAVSVPSLMALAQGSDEPLLRELGVPAKETIVTEMLDATVPAFSTARPSATREDRAAMFSELPWQLSAGSVESMLQHALEKLISVLPAAKRGAIVVSGKSGQMLLKAHVPAGSPAVSLTLVERAIATTSGFIWQRSEDPTMSQAQSRSESGIYAPLIWNGEAYGAICVDNSETISAFEAEDLKLVVSVAHQLALLIANDQLTSRLRRNTMLLERLLTNFSPKTRNLLLAKADQGKLRLGGERSEVTILSSDIRGFTRTAAAMDAHDVVEMLNAYLSVLVGCIFRNSGTVDKFIGDAILAVFGSPEPDPQQHDNGLAAALAMQDAIRALNQERAARGEVICEIGIGLHCGEVLHGFIGTNERMEFTVIGDAVNKTSRYCSAAQAGEIVLSPELHQHVWKMAKTEAVTISTKHEGELPAYRISGALAAPNSP